jgi:hypothetical protein
VPATPLPECSFTFLCPATSGGAIDMIAALSYSLAKKAFCDAFGWSKAGDTSLLLVVEINCIFSSGKESNFQLWQGIEFFLVQKKKAHPMAI